MDLLTFAHRAEASFFLKSQNFKKLELPFELYTGSKAYLLITGEGGENAMAHTALALGYLAKKISRVFNIGVAAGAPDLSLGTVYAVRTCYNSCEKALQFKSFTTSASSTTDLISSSSRVLDKETSSHLFKWAPLIDREAWFVAYSTHCAKLPFYALKIVSDHPGTEKELCQRVKDQAPLFSEELYHYYNQNFCNGQKEEHICNPFLQRPFSQFYFTTAQKRLFLKLWAQLPSWPAWRDQINFYEILANGRPNKEKSSLLISQMRSLISPLHSQLHTQREELFRPVKKEGLQLSFDPDFESDEIKIQASLSTEQDCQKLIATLSQLPFKKYRDLLDGQSLEL